MSFFPFLWAESGIKMLIWKFKHDQIKKFTENNYAQKIEFKDP